MIRSARQERDGWRVGPAGVMFLCLCVLGGIPVAGQILPAARENQQGAQAQKPEDADAAKVLDEQLAAPVDPKTYKIGPEDVLRIAIWKEPELSGVVSVRPDGMISANLVGEVQASDLTPEELGQKLKEEYSKLVNNPIVMVSVQAVRSKKYYLMGNLGRRGAVPLVVPTTILEALSMAGGFAEFANKKKVVILRGDKKFYFNYNDVIKGKNMSQNIYLENGDFIIVN